ncbi:MAG TPA: HAD family hydrolase [Ktedonobacterales bacterium]|nr:HAD family hydrolase [Ktedonobacterales bacterium]
MLFLFDIDGTLLRGMPPAHRQAVCEAAWTVYRVRLSPEDLGQTAGMTDIAILRRAFDARIVDGDLAHNLPEFFACAATAYERLVPADLRGYHTPHARRTLDWLAERGARLGLVTGNIERIAWLKLRAAGLADYFAYGAFGDEAEERAELPALALARAQTHYAATFAAEDVYVVGDTPADIACGAACGLRTVAVATGVIHSLDELRACGPDYAFADLSGLRTLPV